MKLGLFESKGRIFVSSRIVAEKFEKRHDSIVNTVEGLIADSKGCPFQIAT